MGQDADSPAGLPVDPDDRENRRLIDRVREAIRSRRYSRRTEKTYWYWMRFFIRSHGMRHPAELGGAEVQVFRSRLRPEPGDLVVQARDLGHAAAEDDEIRIANVDDAGQRARVFPARASRRPRPAC
jgi:hypothetical protein